jgi:hypothetical protein
MFQFGTATSKVRTARNATKVAADRRSNWTWRFVMDVAYDDALQFTGELSRGVAQPGSAPALGAEKVLPKRLSRTLVFIVFNNLGNLLLVQS